MTPTPCNSTNPATTADPQHDFVVRLRPLKSGAPATCRLRSALKVLLRAFRLRAVSVAEMPVEPTSHAAGEIPRADTRSGPDQV